MEHAFGTPLGDVRIHSDGNAARLARSLSARAFSVGTDVAFAQGQYRPGTPLGDVLLAHELAHSLALGEAGGEHGAEAAADWAAASVGQHLWLDQPLQRPIPKRGAAGPLRLRRCVEGEEGELEPPTVHGPDEMRDMGYRIEIPPGAPTVGRTYELRLRGPLAMRQSATSDVYAGSWFVQEPGAAEPHGQTGWTSGTGLTIIDVTPGATVRDHSGADFEAALTAFANRNSYPAGEVQLRIESNSLGIAARNWSVQTLGASFAQRLSSAYGWASLCIRAVFTNAASPDLRPLAGGATLRPAAQAGGVQTRYELVIPRPGQPDVVVPVRIESTNTRPTSVHGRQTGPARLSVRSTATNGQVNYTASIEVHRDLHRSDVRHAVGHELDELVYIVNARVRGDDITAQKRAALMRPQAARPGAATPAPTAHDRAAAREFADVVRRDSPIGGRPPDFEVPPDLVTRAVGMGFGGTAHLEQKLALLRNAGVDDDMLARLRTMASRAEVVRTVPTSSPVATTRVISHLLHPSGGSTSSPVGGLHLDSALVAHQAELVASNQPIHLLRTADSPRRVGNVTYNAYEQWEWTGGGTPGPRPTTPGGTPGATHGGWVLASEPKTTFNDLTAFLQEADSAWQRWHAANGSQTPGTNIRWSHASPSGQQIGGYADVISSGPPMVVEMISVFPDRAGGLASW